MTHSATLSFDESPQGTAGRLRRSTLSTARSVHASTPTIVACSSRSIGERHGHLVDRALAEDVVVGDHVAVRRHDHAGAEARRVAFAAVSGIAEELIEERVVEERRCALAHDLHRGDVGHRAHGLFGDAGEIRSGHRRGDGGAALRFGRGLRRGMRLRTRNLVGPHASREDDARDQACEQEDQGDGDALDHTPRVTRPLRRQLPGRMSGARERRDAERLATAPAGRSGLQRIRERLAQRRRRRGGGRGRAPWE